MKRALSLIVLAVTALVAAAAAFGYAAGRDVQIRRGDLAVFPWGSGGWACGIEGAMVWCGSGDARPYVELTSSKHGGTVIVHTLRYPQNGLLVRKLDKWGEPMFTFSANR